MKNMMMMGILLCVTSVLAEPTRRFELNDGWRFSQDEALGPLREFSIPSMLEMLDDQGRDLLELPSASIFPVNCRPGARHPFLAPGFKDASWESVRVPHDAGIAYSFSPDLRPFDGYLPGTGTAWYRYKFKVESSKLKVEDADCLVALPDGRKVTVEKDGKLFFDCDGAMAFPMLWLNGSFVGGWPNGYMPWRVDLTPFLKTGENVLAIRVYRPEDYARWHTGLGLTRRCWFESAPKDHVVPDSVAITTTVKGLRLEGQTPKAASATVKVVYRMSVGGAKEKTFTVENPRLWDVADPHLYEVDVEGNTFRYGIRTIDWTVDDGFHLNGRRVQIKGFCFHQDLCSLGSVANRTAIRRRLEKARALGMNAVRMSHYPHAVDWYELCDELGLLVMDELTDAWGQGKLYNDYHRLFPRWHERDLRRMIRRHRNHPSIVIWSLGNEIWESRHGEEHWPLYQRNGVEMNRIAHQEDATRPTTTANDNVNVWRSPYAQFQDVWGFNYRPACYAEYRRLWPGRPVVGTETMCVQTSRGEYFFHPDFAKDGKFGVPGPGRCYVDFLSSSYGLHAITPADYEWAQQDANPFVAGSFAWTAFDYFGSPAVMILRGQKPYYSDSARQAAAMADRARYGRVRGGIHSCPTGVFDLAGLLKDEGWLYLSRWRPDVPSCHVLPHWNWDVTTSVQKVYGDDRAPEVVPDRIGLKTPVYVYSSGDEVELFVNGVSQGRRGREKGLWRFRFNDVVYQPGELKAVAYKDGAKWSEETVKTSGTPARLVATPERAAIAADGEDVGYVTLKVVDKDGNFCPTAKIPVQISVAGDGTFLSAENGDETDFAWFRDTTRKTFNGLLSALVRAKPGRKGTITVTFTAEGLPPTTAQIAVGE